MGKRHKASNGTRLDILFIAPQTNTTWLIPIIEITRKAPVMPAAGLLASGSQGGGASDKRGLLHGRLPRLAALNNRAC